MVSTKLDDGAFGVGNKQKGLKVDGLTLGANGFSELVGN